MIVSGVAMLLGNALQSNPANVPPEYVAVALLLVGSPVVVLLWLGTRASAIQRRAEPAAEPKQAVEYLDYRDEISNLRKDGLEGVGELEISPSVSIETAAEEQGVCVMRYSTPENSQGRRLFSTFAVRGVEFVRDQDGSARCAAVLAALNSSKLNVAYTVRSSKGSFEILVSVIEEGDAEEVEERRLEAEKVVRNLFPGAQIIDVDSPYEYAWSTVGGSSNYGMITGIPAFKQGQLAKVASQLGSTEWFYTAVSYPIERGVLESMLLDVEAETKRVVEESAWVTSVARPIPGSPEASARESGASALAYLSMLRAHRSRLETGIKSGAWNVVLYFGAPDRGVYQQLKNSLLEGQTSESSRLEPLRAFDLHPAEAIRPLLLTFNHPFVEEAGQRKGVLSFLFSDSNEGGPAEGSFPPFPNSYETFLTSPELRAYTTFPNASLPGFQVEYAPRFDTTPPSIPEGEGVEVGTIYQGRAATTDKLLIPAKALSKQTLILGDQDSGAESMVYSLARQSVSRGMSFIGVDPSGRRLRNLRLMVKGSKVYTVGSDSFSPLSFNPLWVPPERSAWEHIRFIAPSFQALVPEIPRSIRFFEGALERLYRTHGWDMEQKRGTVPTIAELRAGINKHFEPLGIPKESAWLRARIREGLGLLLSPELGGLFQSRDASLRESAKGSAVFELWPLRDERVRRFVYSSIVSLTLEEDIIARDDAREGRLMMLKEPSFLYGRSDRTANSDLVQLIADYAPGGGGMLLVESRPSALGVPFSDLATVASFRLASAGERSAAAGFFRQGEDVKEYLSRLDQNFAVVRTGEGRGEYLVYAPRSIEEATEVPDDSLGNL